MPSLFGSDNSSAEMMKQQQRRSLADLARQQGEVDQAGSTGGRKAGRGLLTFLQSDPNKLSGGGSSTFGSA